MAPRNRRSDSDRYRDQSGPGAARQPFENFHAGYLRIDEDHLYRTGIRGPKKYALYCLVGLLILLTFANLIVTVAIIGTLRISHRGLDAFEFVPRGRLWRVFHDVDAYFPLVFSGKTTLGSHRKQNLTFDTYQASVHFIGNKKDPSIISVQPNGTTVTADRVSVVSSKTSQVLFSSDSFTTDDLHETPRTLTLGKLQVKKLTSRVDETLSVDADRNVYMTGMEGVDLEGAGVSLSASDAITFTTTHGSISMSGPEGVSISETMATYPYADQSEAYKLCVCASTGQVFLSSPGLGCYHTGKENPCSL